MRRDYEISLECSDKLSVGQWVEIFRAQASTDTNSPIQVGALRVHGEILTSSPSERSDGLQPLHPHEGQITAISYRSDCIRFRIDMTLN